MRLRIKFHSYLNRWISFAACCIIQVRLPHGALPWDTVGRGTRMQYVCEV